MNTPADQWTEAIIRAGYTDPRYREDRPSFSRLAEAAGLHTTTVSRLVRGVGKPKPGVVEAVAAALGVDVRFVSEWAQQVRSETRPYEPPAEVNLLTRREQDAVTELIRAIAAREERTGEPQSTTSTEQDQTADQESDPEEHHNAQHQRPTMTRRKKRSRLSEPHAATSRRPAREDQE